MWSWKTRRQDERAHARGLALGERAREEVANWKHVDDRGHSGEAMVENASDARVKQRGRRVLRCHQRAEGLGMQSMITDVGLSAQVRAWQRSQSVRIKKRSRKDQTC